MKRPSRVESAAIIGFAALACGVSAGCGMAGEMVKDPTPVNSTTKLGQEPVPLAVVVRRADVASATATQVDRLLTATPVDATSAWPKQTQLSADDVTAMQKQLADHPYYDGTQWAIAPAEVWASALGGIKSDSGQSSSLLSAIAADLGGGYAGVEAKIDAMAALETRRKAERDAADQKDVSDADKKAHKTAADALTAQIDVAKKDIDVTKKSFGASCQAAAAKVPADVRDGFSPVIVNLRNAVHEAKVANIAATMRYPFVAMEVIKNPVSLKDTLVLAARGNASDVLFEQVGKRLKVETPQIVYENGRVAVTLAGIGMEAVGKLSIEQFIAETTIRTGKFAVEAVTLPLVIASTQEKLDFEADVLDGIKDGFHASGGSAAAPAEVSVKTSLEIHAGVTPPTGISLNPFARK